VTAQAGRRDRTRRFTSHNRIFRTGLDFQFPIEERVDIYPSGGC
jgi:hypothetical protein